MCKMGELSYGGCSSFRKPITFFSLSILYGLTLTAMG